MSWEISIKHLFDWRFSVSVVAKAVCFNQKNNINNEDKVPLRFICVRILKLCQSEQGCCNEAVNLVTVQLNVSIIADFLTDLQIFLSHTHYVFKHIILLLIITAVFVHVLLPSSVPHLLCLEGAGSSEGWVCVTWREEDLLYIQNDTGVGCVYTMYVGTFDIE